MKQNTEHRTSLRTWFARAGVLVALFLFGGGNAQALFVLVSNRGGDNITKYDFDTGAYLGVFANTGDQPYAMAADSSGNVYVTCLSDRLIYKFDIRGTSLGALPIAAWDGMIAIHNDFLYTSDYNSGDVKKYDLDGSFISTVATIDNNGAQGMTWDQNNNLLVADYNGFNYSGTIRQIAPNGTVSTFATLGPPHTGFSPMALVVDSSGNVYASDPPYKYNVRKFNSSGTDTGITFATGQGIWGMTIGTNDIIYAVNMTDSSIHKYATDGTDLGVFSSVGLNDAQAGIVITLPEPSAAALLATGAVAMFARFRTRRSR